MMTSTSLPRCILDRPTRSRAAFRFFAFLPLLLTVQFAAAQTFVELYPFNSSGNLADGGWPESAVVRDAAGNLYGTTFYGGLGTGCDVIYAGCGTVFKVDPSGTETVLHAFSGAGDGWNPTGNLVLDAAGNLYGTTLLGGSHGFGTVFKVNSAGDETVLYSFARGSDGGNPNAGLTQDAAGNFYGTTQYGGDDNYEHGNGTVFELSPAGQETILYRFKGGPDGASPLSGVILDTTGNIYGTTWVGGLYGFGTVFQLDSGGNETVLHSFAGASDGANPLGSLVLDEAGNLYGTTSAGGPYGFGTVFTIDAAGSESVLYSFIGGSDGAYPYSNLILDASGNLYGTASQGGCCSGAGTVFELSGDTLTPLYGFAGTTDGAYPMAGLVLDSADNLYGTAVQAGVDGWGSVFEIQPASKAVNSHTQGKARNVPALDTQSHDRQAQAVGPADADKIDPICNPTLTAPIVVESSHARFEAGNIAEPPLTPNQGFDWPDGPIAALKTDQGYMFFSIDAGLHARQLWHGQWVGNNNSGSVVRTIGTLDDPLGTDPPVDVVIDHNPDPKVNPHNCDPTKRPHAGCYTYIGGGPVYQVPQDQTGAGNWLLVYHAEYDDPAYFMLGLAISFDRGLHWTDIGEIIRYNHPFSYQGPPAPGAIGDPPLVISPDGKYFYVYFFDWLIDGSNTMVSVARAPIADVLQAAFGGVVHYAAPFYKYYQDTWNQPGIGGESTDLSPNSRWGGGENVAWNSYLQRYIMLNNDSQNTSYQESIDGLHWTDSIFLGMQGHVPDVAGYDFPIGLGDDPRILGKEFYVYLTQFRGPWPGGQSVKRFTMTCR
jgi:uncharacterized repeat protein (TIGR03803 family)